MPKQSYRDCFCFRFCRCISKAPQKVKEHFGRSLNKHRLETVEFVVRVPHAIKTLFEQYSENGIMTVDHLHRFLIDIQEEENATKEDAQAIFYSLDDEEFKGLNQSAFFKYLFGDINPPLSPSRQLDTLLPSMKMGRDSNSGMIKHLTSWKNSSDPSRGNLTYKLENFGLPQFVLQDGSVKKFRTGHWNGERFSGFSTLRSRTRVFKPIFVYNSEDLYYTDEVYKQFCRNKIYVGRVGRLNALC